MELKHYVSIILKRLWIIILIPLIAGLASVYLSFFVITPIYEANATLYIIDKNRDVDDSDSGADISYNEIWVGGQLVKDYTELIKSRTITSSVIEQLDLKDITPEQLAGMISVNAQNDTRLIQVSISDKDPERAMEINNTLCNLFIDLVDELMQFQNVNIVDPAVLPTEPVSPRKLYNVAIALFAGVFVAVGIIFLIENLDDTIKTNEDVERYLNIPVLADIPKLNLK